MSATYTYPGVYIQELPSPVHTIAGVATSIAAFVGYTPPGIDNRAQTISSFADFERLYGGLASNSELSYAVSQFYQKAARRRRRTRPKHGAAGAKVVFDSLTFTALSTGPGPTACCDRHRRLRTSTRRRPPGLQPHDHQPSPNATTEFFPTSR